MAVQHYLRVTDLDQSATLALLRRAARLKASWRRSGRPSKKLRGYTLAAIYEKPSLRTRVTFEAGMNQLGGHTVSLMPADIRLGQRESVADVARNLARWVQIIAARTFSHSIIQELATHSAVPVINALSDLEHPCQALADFLTFEEHVGELRGRKLAYIGDGNNVANSLMLMGAMLGVHIAIASPAGYEPDSTFVGRTRALAQQTGANVVITQHPEEAVIDADAVYTDVWASMGQENEAEARNTVFAAYQVTPELIRATGNPNAVFMHCLPAHRGQEVSAEVMDGPHSVVFDQAENRLHAQKALILTLLNK